MAPGPRVAEQTPALPGEPAVDLGHERRRLLVADQDVADGGSGQRLGEVDVLLPGNAEHAGDALVLEALDQEFSGTPSFVSHSTERTESRRQALDQRPRAHESMYLCEHTNQVNLLQAENLWDVAFDCAIKWRHRTGTTADEKAREQLTFLDEYRRASGADLGDVAYWEIYANYATALVWTHPDARRHSPDSAEAYTRRLRDLVATLRRPDRRGGWGRVAALAVHHGAAIPWSLGTPPGASAHGVPRREYWGR